MAAATKARAVLFDIDGVLVRNARISSAIEKRAVSYVHSRTKVSLDRSVGLNKMLYQTYGHTWAGVKAAFNVKDSIEDYNDYVYDKATLGECFNELATKLNANENKSAMQTVSRLHDKAVPVYLFTNAPDTWADAVVQAFDLGIRPERCITSSFGLKMHSLNMYEKVKNYVKDLDGNVKTLVYVEDQFRNLTPILNRPEWQPVLLDSHFGGKTLARTVVVNDLDEVLNIGIGA